MVKNLPASAGDMGSIPGPGRYTCRGAAKSIDVDGAKMLMELLGFA